MGKFIKKSKEAAAVAKTDMSFGVCTRAKALALQRPPYQLRSRRLLGSPNNRPRFSNPNPNFNLGHVIACKTSRNRGGDAIINVKLSLPSSTSRKTPFSALVKYLKQDGVVPEAPQTNERAKEEVRGKRRNGSRVGVSFREKQLFNASERASFEPARYPESAQTSGSSAISAGFCQTRRRRRRVPSIGEMEEFFEDAEKEQLHDFITKYNFDPVKEKPLPGRFEWTKV